jgi:peptidoglycan-N-acetylglucosamine deacetylase
LIENWYLAISQKNIMKHHNLLSPFLIIVIFIMLSSAVNAQGYQSGSTIRSSDFKWPEGKEMAISLTFDDARLSQPDLGIPLLDKYGVKATFYLSPDNMLQRVDDWKRAVKNGHDIGNHSLLHPCTGNFDWSRNKALENYTLLSMNSELDSANALINMTLGITPVSFAYPCGQKFVGRGKETKSYIPVVAAKFESGRGWLDEAPNDPSFCDMSQLTGMELDGKSFDQIKAIIETARAKGSWLVLAGHEMKDGGSQTSLLSTIEAICKYAADPANGIWIDDVHAVASYIKEKRGEPAFSAEPVCVNPIFPVEQSSNDLLSDMTLEEKVGLTQGSCMAGRSSADIRLKGSFEVKDGYEVSEIQKK